MKNKPKNINFAATGGIGHGAMQRKSGSLVSGISSKNNIQKISIKLNRKKRKIIIYSFGNNMTIPKFSYIIHYRLWERDVVLEYLEQWYVNSTKFYPDVNISLDIE